MAEKGTVVFDEGRFAIGCSILDLSESGAQIRLPLGVAIPERFFLLLTGERTAAACAIAWRKLPVCGVRLLVRYRLSALPPGLEYLVDAARQHAKSAVT